MPNQVAMSYNAFGQLIEEQQAHRGAVSGSNEIGLKLLTYPNGRLIIYSFGSGLT